MDKISNLTKQTFFRLLNGDMSISDFEQWIYTSGDLLEQELESEIYLELVSFNYKQKDSLQLLINKAKTLVNMDEFNIWRTSRLLTDIIENNLDLVLATRKLRQLYFETGKNIIPETLGIGFESELDDLPIPSEYNQWESSALQKTLEKADQYKDEIVRDAKLLLHTLNKSNKDNWA